MRRQRQVFHLLRASASFVILFDKMSNTEESDSCHTQRVTQGELGYLVNYEVIPITSKVNMFFSFIFRFSAFIGEISFIFCVTKKTKTFMSSLHFKNWSDNKTRQHWNSLWKYHGLFLCRLTQKSELFKCMRGLVC